MLLFIIICFIGYIILSKREGYSIDNDPFIQGMKDRFIDPMKHRYINQIDYYRDAPNINLERALSQPALSPDDIDWSKVSDSEYPILINYLSGKNDATKIKSINAI
jgi:hypothetical protein